MTDHEERAYVLDNLDEVVVKAVSESGGYGMLIGPSFHAGAARRVRARDPRATRATTSPSPWSRSRGTSATSTAQLEARHIDLRPFVIYGEDIEVVPGRADARGADARARWW